MYSSYVYTYLPTFPDYRLSIHESKSDSDVADSESSQPQAELEDGDEEGDSFDAEETLINM